MREITGLVLHCSASPAGYAQTLEEIDQYHRSLGWDSVGYHYVIELDGKVRQGRPHEVVGAHVYGHNRETLGICYVGGRDRTNTHNANTLNAAQERSLRQLVDTLLKTYPNATVCGHRDYAGVAKDCPCFDARDWYYNLRVFNEA